MKKAKKSQQRTLPLDKPAAAPKKKAKKMTATEDVPLEPAPQPQPEPAPEPAPEPQPEPTTTGGPCDVTLTPSESEARFNITRYA